VKELLKGIFNCLGHKRDRYVRNSRRVGKWGSHGTSKGGFIRGGKGKKEHRFVEIFLVFVRAQNE
jgi:hypothetical protein